MLRDASTFAIRITDSNGKQLSQYVLNVSSLAEAALHCIAHSQVTAPLTLKFEIVELISTPVLTIDSEESLVAAILTYK